MKKALIIVVITILAIGSINPIASYMAENGFKDKNPASCLTAARIKQRFFMYGSALSIHKKIINRFPDFKDIGYCFYYMAYCYEKTDKTKQAMESYKEYISNYPNHKFNKIAAKRLSNLDANFLE
jgi:tetratricopeptide (TPR) repeat protein